MGMRVVAVGTVVTLVLVGAIGCSAPKPVRSPEPIRYTLAAIDVVGSKHVPSEDIVAASGFTIGSKLENMSEALLEQMVAATEQLKSRYGFALVQISPTTYLSPSPDAGKMFITIDVVDRDDAARLQLAPAPSLTPPDPEGLIAAWRAYEEVMWPLINSGAYKPPYTCQGGLHCGFGFNHDELRDRESLFITKAAAHFDALVAVLRTHRDTEQRAAAAFVLAYAGPRERVVAALVPSTDDPDAGVRNNVMRVLFMIQQGSPAAIVPLAPVIRAMQFPSNSDRNKAAYALLELAKRASPADRQQITDELGDLLIAMTAMHQPNNRDPAWRS